MEEIGVRDLRQHASRFLARVEAGEELAITNNGRLVARLVPVQPATQSRQALIDAGIVMPAAHPEDLTEVLATIPPARTRTLTDILNEMRDEQ